MTDIGPARIGPKDLGADSAEEKGVDIEKVATLLGREIASTTLNIFGEMGRVHRVTLRVQMNDDEDDPSTVEISLEFPEWDGGE